MMESKKYKLQDGGIITATGAADFVTRLRESSKFDSECTDQEYMTNFANRYLVQTGNVVRTDNSENFFRDLLESGFVEI